ncbi:MAG: type VI secretion protein IcmF/TssM N-terminal domain-containing protein [Pseudomonadota bacterium]
MKGMFSKILKVVFIVVAVLLAALLIVGAVLVLNWPWWTGIFILAGLAGIGVGILLIKRILLRRREEHFVQEVIEQDEARMKTVAEKERGDQQELQQRWNEAITALRRSHLRKLGNPLYVLPWYMVIGESGSGKTTAIKSARLSSPFAEITRVSGISGTRNCDWWFFEQAIIIDTAGRYAIPVDEGRDKEEWQRFLGLLVKYRRREPLNGLIVSLPADKLLQADPSVMEEDGRSIRRRVEELMRALGTKVPVYLLVTKCDLVKGMAQFCEYLPPKGLDQAMGFLRSELGGGMEALLEKAFASIGERLRNLRLLLLHQMPSGKMDPGLFLFPEEFDHLRKGLAAFMNVAFSENPYQETPVVRGVFFSSGRQEGSPYSHFLHAMGFIGEREVLPGTDKGLFLHDLFAKILPGERRVLAPTQRALQWRLLTRNMGLVSWISLVIAICGLLSFSFVKNLKILRDISQFANTPALQGEMTSDLESMDRFRRSILKVEAQNEGWWMPRFGLRESIRIESEMKDRYRSRFQKGLLASFDRQTGSILTGLTAATPDEVIGSHVSHLVRRINLLKSRAEDEGFETLVKKPRPSYDSSAGFGNRTAESLAAKKFGDLYFCYVAWRSDQGEINRELTTLQAWLRHILSLKGGQLQWLTTCINRQDSVRPVTLGDFWGGNLPAPDEAAIPPAFTLKGRDLMESFLKEVESALPDVALRNQKASFDRWYRDACFTAWHQFAAGFPKGVNRLRDRRGWQQMAAQMASEQGPYFAFLNRMTDELDPLSDEGSLPSWLEQAYRLQLLKAQGPAGGLLAKAAEEGKKLVVKVKERIGKQAGGLESSVSAIKAYQDYYRALAAITPSAASSAQAYKIAFQTFSEDPATGKSPFITAKGAAVRLKSITQDGSLMDEVIWQLVSGPVDFLWSFVRMETALNLQQQWEQTVLAEIQGAEGPQAAQLMFSPDGPVWKFVKGPAAPFVSFGIGRGYYAREVLGGAVPFEGSFFSFLRQNAPGKQAAVKSNYSVAVRGLPTDSNSEARFKPHATRLDLQCAGITQTLLNQNFPVSKTFQWAPGACGDVTLQIEVGDLVLTRYYMGDQGFLDFLKDFPGGQHTFYPNDFPGERPRLNAMGIKYIKVRYDLSGHQAILGGLGSLSGGAPRQIVRCW